MIYDIPVNTFILNSNKDDKAVKYFHRFEEIGPYYPDSENYKVYSCFRRYIYKNKLPLINSNFGFYLSHSWYRNLVNDLNEELEHIHLNLLYENHVRYNLYKDRMTGDFLEEYENGELEFVRPLLQLNIENVYTPKTARILGYITIIIVRMTSLAEGFFKADESLPSDKSALQAVIDRNNEYAEKYGPYTMGSYRAISEHSINIDQIRGMNNYERVNDLFSGKDYPGQTQILELMKS